MKKPYGNQLASDFKIQHFIKSSTRISLQRWIVTFPEDMTY